MRIDLQPAYILHTRPYRDTSALIDLLTLDYGLVRAVGRGVRGSRRRMPLQQHQPLLVSLSGKGELLTLTHAEAAAPGFYLTGDRLFSAMYLNELLSRLLQHQESHPALYRLYQRSLLKLQQTYPLEPLLREFEWCLLQELGYGIDVTDVSAEKRYSYLDGAGLVEAGTTEMDVMDGGLLLELAQCYASATETQMNAPLLSTAKRLMRLALKPLLGNKPLMSRRLFTARSAPGAVPGTVLGTPRLPPDSNTG
tara:strand:+ start:23195 stop:23950 length:756 start_codon:yes stop_codon:yes gene_type:complete